MAAVEQAFSVLCSPSGRSFEARRGETILAAGLRSGLTLAHSCRNGVCGTCKSRVIQGTVAPGSFEPGALSNTERHEGYVLACQAQALSPVTIECALVEGLSEFPLRRLVCRVAELERLAHDVMRIRLRQPAKSRLGYLPGQYIEIVMNGGIRRSLSLARPPTDEDDILELHLRNYAGPFSKHVFGTMKVGDLVRVEGPLGTFFVREESDKPMIFVASGTGFAPIKAMLEDQVRKGCRRTMALYWGGRRPSDLYLDSLARDWVDRQAISYIPVVSEALPQDGWKGRTGFVHRAVMEDYPDLSGHEVYACGAPIVVESARKEFALQRHLPATAFHADMFAPGAPAPIANAAIPAAERAA
jgi:CDP-4-dehydro-6-deoxyglucose reductase